MLKHNRTPLRQPPDIWKIWIGLMIIAGIGTDIVECLRIAQMIERHGELFLTRVYTPYEIDYCSARKAATQHYAGRFAAKEAVLKALGTGWTRGIHWADIEVRNDLGGKPSIALAGGARELCGKLGITEMLISISHCRSHATAFAVAVTDSDPARLSG
jgi:holo-[acyl-carrier protein] synthase